MWKKSYKKEVEKEVVEKRRKMYLRPKIVSQIHL